MASNRFKTTITKKDGTTASGYIENDRGYYDDGTALSAGDSIIDAQNKVWTKADASAGAGAGTGSTGNNTPGGMNALTDYANKVGVNVPSGIGDYSATSSYSVDKAEKPSRTGLRSARELGALYDIGYDMNEIRSLYDSATNAKYALKSKELKQAENDFYANQANANATLLDTLRKATSSAIATGASRGLASAEQLGLAMEAQQGIIEGATDMAQQRANMADEIAVEKAENIIKALEYSNQLKQGLATNSTNIYSADTQYDVGLLDFLVNNRSIDSQERVNYRGQDMDALQFILGDATDRSEGAANRALQDKMNQDTIAGNLDAARITAAGYSSGGSGYNQRTWYDDVKDAEEASKLAYSTGNVSLYVAAQRQLTGETEDEIKDRVDSDPNFPGSKAYKKRVEKEQKEAKKEAEKAEKINKKLQKEQKEVFTSYSKPDGSRVIEYADGSTKTISAQELKDLSEIETTFRAR